MGASLRQKGKVMTEAEGEGCTVKDAGKDKETVSPRTYRVQSALLQTLV